jgi:hypothetical protein
MQMQEELAELRQALAGVNRALRPLRERPASQRLVRRLEADLRRMQEDVDDLALEAVAVTGVATPAVTDMQPIPIPPRDPVTTYDPECEDEGLAGWRTQVS